jgi:hypothetical protein
MPKPRNLESNPQPPKPRKSPPHPFVLEALEPLHPRTKPMFSCTAVYIGPKLALFLRNSPNQPEDNGVWLATLDEHHASLRTLFPNMRPIALLDGKITSWQLLPQDAPDFEESALLACELVAKNDPRIGKIPKPRPSRAKSQRLIKRIEIRSI